MVKPAASSLRIIGGSWRGRKVSFEDAPALRPTPNRVRETLFNWLAPGIEGANCLDLFAGSGILSMEALSRGARHVTIVDSSTAAILQIGRELALLNGGKASSRATLATADAMHWMGDLDGTASQFDLVFIDPPFESDLTGLTCEMLERYQLLAPEALIYLESATPIELQILPDGWAIHRQKQASHVHYCLCRGSQ